MLLKTGWQWTPYKLLPALKSELGSDDIELEDDDEAGDEKINSGGPAMMAYAEMQFMETTSERREDIKNALLRYCELDTLAMVMIYEHWKNLIDQEK